MKAHIPCERTVRRTHSLNSTPVGWRGQWRKRAGIETCYHRWCVSGKPGRASDNSSSEKWGRRKQISINIHSAMGGTLKISSTQGGSSKGHMCSLPDSVTYPSPVTYLPTKTLKSSIKWDQGGKTRHLCVVQTLDMNLPSNPLDFTFWRDTGHSPNFHFTARVLVQTSSFLFWTWAVLCLSLFLKITRLPSL